MPEVEAGLLNAMILLGGTALGMLLGEAAAWILGRPRRR